jgi:hypothetical protein
MELLLPSSWNLRRLASGRGKGPGEAVVLHRAWSDRHQPLETVCILQLCPPIRETLLQVGSLIWLGGVDARQKSDYKTTRASSFSLLSSHTYWIRNPKIKYFQTRNGAPGTFAASNGARGQGGRVGQRSCLVVSGRSPGVARAQERPSFFTGCCRWSLVLEHC